MVAIEGRRARDGRALEILGYYDPLTDPATVRLDEERIRNWMSRGAKPSETVMRLMRQAGMPEGGKPPETPPKAPGRSRKAKAEAPPTVAAAPPKAAEPEAAVPEAAERESAEALAAEPESPKAEAAEAEEAEKKEQA